MEEEEKGLFLEKEREEVVGFGFQFISLLAGVVFSGFEKILFMYTFF